MSKWMVYTSSFFTDVGGTPLARLIPTEALSTYQKVDNCLILMKEQGGIHAKATPEFMKLRKQMLSARRKIERMGWQNTAV